MKLALSNDSTFILNYEHERKTSSKILKARRNNSYLRVYYKLSVGFISCFV